MKTGGSTVVSLRRNESKRVEASIFHRAGFTRELAPSYVINGASRVRAVKYRPESGCEESSAARMRHTGNVREKGKTRALKTNRSAAGLIRTHEREETFRK